MKKISFILTMLVAFMGTMHAQSLPIDFEMESYTFVDFGGNASLLGIDPTNSQNGVAVTTKALDANTWAGTTMGSENGFVTAIPFTETETSLSVRVYSPKAGIKIRLKAEDHNDVTLTAETETSTTVKNTWETLVFDFSNVATGTNPFHLTTNFDKLSIFFDFGNTGDDSVYYWDDVIFMAAPEANDASLTQLMVNGNSVPNFNPATLNYDVLLPFATGIVPEVTAVSNHTAATIVVTPATALPGTSQILVTSSDKSTEQTYTIAFTVSDQASTDATLSYLRVNEIDLSGFSPEKLDYFVELPEGTLDVPIVTAGNANFATVAVTPASSLPGTTSVVVTAQDGSTQLTYTIAFSLSTLSLPIDFETGPYSFVDFSGGSATVISNPQSMGINTSNTVAQIIRDGEAIWAGSKLILNHKIDFTSMNTISMKVFSTRADIPVLFKLEGADGAATQVSVNTTVANEWETLTWDFTGSASNVYDALVFMFDFGTVGDGSAHSTFLFDDVELYDITGGLTQINLPVTFDNPSVYYVMEDFGGNETTLGADPNNAGNTVAISTKTTGAATWAGTTIGTGKGFSSRVPLTTSASKMSMWVYSPLAGIKVRLKGEDHNDVTLTVETEATTTRANAWENLTFDFTKVATGTNPFNPNTNFDKFSVFFNFGVEGSNQIYYWDNVEFGEGTTTSITPNDTKQNHIYAANNLLHIQVADVFINGSIEVFDATGRMIHSQICSENQQHLSLHTSGLVIVKIAAANHEQVIVSKTIMK